MTDAFGADTPAMSVDDLARAIKGLKVEKTPASKLPDVIDIIEHLRDHALSLHAENLRASTEIAERVKALEARERELALRQKAVDAVLRVDQPKRKYFWR